VFRILGRTRGPRTRIGETVQVVLLCVLDRGPRLRLQSVRHVVLAATARVAQVELRRRPPVCISERALTTIRGCASIEFSIGWRRRTGSRSSCIVSRASIAARSRL